MSKELTWPAWFNGPNGQTAIFEAAEDVPNGWTSGAEKQSLSKSEKKSAPEKKQDAGNGPELDADGHPYDPALHAATKSKTKDGLWRMKVGVSRPAPAPGYPLDL